MNTDATSSGSNMLAYSLLVLTTLCWGMNAVLGKFAVGEVSPMALVSLRWLGVVLLMAVIAQRQIKRDWPILKKRLVYLLIMGSLGFTGFNTLFYVSAHSTTAVNIGILQGSIPVFVIAAAYFALKDKITPVQGIGVFVTILGVVIVGSGGSFERLAGLELNRGDLMMLAACALYAGYTVALRFKPQVAALSFFAIMAIAALLTSLPFTIVEIQLEHFQAPTSAGWIVVILVTLFPSFIAQLAFIRGVGILGPGRAGVFANLVPVFASIFAVSFLGEPFEMYQGTALILVLFGIWLSERGKRTKPAA